MPYLGNDLQVAQPSYRNIDDISGSFNSSTTSFPLLVSGAAPIPFPINSNQCLISVAGVVQRPDDSGTEGFRISGGNIIFSSAPSTGSDFFGVILAGADYVNVGANFPSGSAAVPSITFDSDLDTGIYNSAANQVSIATAGTEKLRIDSAGQIEAVSLGTAAAPTFSFTTDPNTGIYSPGADQVAISTNGSGRLFVDSSGQIGLGTSSPVSTLTANSGASNNTRIYLQSNAGSGSTNAGFMLGFVGTDSYCYSYANGNLLFGTNNAERMRVDSSGRVGIGTTSPQSALNLGDTSAESGIQLGDGADFTIKRNVASLGVQFNVGSDLNNYQFQIGGSERARIDSSGRLLVGTSTSVQAADVSSKTQIVANGSDNLALHMNLGAFGYGATLLLGRSRNTTYGSFTKVESGDNLGAIRFYGDDGTDYNTVGAEIIATADGTTGSNDLPTRLTFSVTSDGSASPVERGKLINSGYWKFSNNGDYNDSQGTSASHYFQHNASGSSTFIATAWNNSFANNMQQNTCLRAANSAYSFFNGVSGNGSTSFADDEFRLRGDGNGLCDGAWTGGGADYAEYFEWSDSNPDAEDRRGISVVLDEDKIREAVAGEDPIGVISGNPSVVGDAAWNKWNGKYLRDEFGTYIQEDYEVTDDDGNTVIQQRRKLNPAYDPDVEYISREQRPEWDCVGLMGKLRIRKGQITGSRWVKMRDISDSVEEWLVR